jgi:hypothetical protein
MKAVVAYVRPTPASALGWDGERERERETKNLGTVGVKQEVP